jgi:hypothetical protein
MEFTVAIPKCLTAVDLPSLQVEQTATRRLPMMGLILQLSYLGLLCFDKSLVTFI